MAKASNSTRPRRTKVGGAARTSGRAGPFERQVVRVATTLGRLVGGAESRWQGLKDQRQKVVSAVETVRRRATSVLPRHGAEAQLETTRTASRRTKKTTPKRPTARKLATSDRPAKATRARAASSKRR
jgi:hypothetical protein